MNGGREEVKQGLKPARKSTKTATDTMKSTTFVPDIFNFPLLVLTKDLQKLKGSRFFLNFCFLNYFLHKKQSSIISFMWK